MADKNGVNAAVERALGLEAELEVSGVASTEAEHLAVARGILHIWVDTVVGVVAVPGSGRVTLIHADGGRSHIASPVLPYQLSRPVKWDN